MWITRKRLFEQNAKLHERMRSLEREVSDMRIGGFNHVSPRAFDEFRMKVAVMEDRLNGIPPLDGDVKRHDLKVRVWDTLGHNYESPASLQDVLRVIMENVGIDIRKQHETIVADERKPVVRRGK